MKGSHTVSILQGKEKCCYITGKRGILHKHHIYHGTGLRKISDKYGFWCYLIPELHNCSAQGVHGRDGAELDRRLKAECQRKFEEEHSREEFMKIIGRNYLD